MTLTRPLPAKYMTRLGTEFPSLHSLGLRPGLIVRLGVEGISSPVGLSRILRITDSGKITVEVDEGSALGYASGREICGALADHGFPMVNCSSDPEVGER